MQCLLLLWTRDCGLVYEPVLMSLILMSFFLFFFLSSDRLCLFLESFWGVVPELFTELKSNSYSDSHQLTDNSCSSSMATFSVLIVVYNSISLFICLCFEAFLNCIYAFTYILLTFLWKLPTMNYIRYYYLSRISFLLHSTFFFYTFVLLTLVDRR